MKKKTVCNKIKISAAVLALAAVMLAGCGRSDDRSSDEVMTEEAADPAGMVHLENAEEVTAFMDEVYQGVAEDLLPMDVTTTELDLSDTDMIQYHTGLTDLGGIDGIYLSESMISSTPYSAVYIRTKDDADAAAIRQQLMDNVDPAKWICVSAEKQYAALVGGDIFFVMSFSDTAEAVLKGAQAAAASREMNADDVIDKTNPI